MTPMSFVDYKSTSQFINHILSNCQSPKNSRAIIDIRATFQGINNLTVANELAAYIKIHQDQYSKPIKHVLYFDDG